MLLNWPIGMSGVSAETAWELVQKQVEHGISTLNSRSKYNFKAYCLFSECWPMNRCVGQHKIKSKVTAHTHLLNTIIELLPSHQCKRESSIAVNAAWSILFRSHRREEKTHPSLVLCGYKLRVLPFWLEVKQQPICLCSNPPHPQLTLVRSLKK